MISTHILDTSMGQPAANVVVKLEKQDGVSKSWKVLSQDKTNLDGRVVFAIPSEAGKYKLTFGINEYFQKNQMPTFFEDAEVCVNISDTKRKYHIPLLLNPFGYSTYRGS